MPQYLAGHIAGTAWATAALMAVLFAAGISSGSFSLENLILSGIRAALMGGIYFTGLFVVGALPAKLFDVIAKRLVLRHRVWPMLYGSLVGLLCGWCPAIVLVFFFESSDAPLGQLLRDPRVVTEWFFGYILPGAAWGAGWWRTMQRPRIDIAPTRS
ncbi:hypothetical protein V5F29_03555 [Xanthobacter aminoxidans]|uniref:hypothetical protein n=1 Tax=Xanthobacter aminoxidans TaxID=186280 RepID=UPI00372A1DB1